MRCDVINEQKEHYTRTVMHSIWLNHVLYKPWISDDFCQSLLWMGACLLAFLLRQPKIQRSINAPLLAEWSLEGPHRNVTSVSNLDPFRLENQEHHHDTYLPTFQRFFPLEFKLQRPKSWDNFWIFMIKPSLGHLNLRRCSSGPLVTFLLTALEGWDNHGKTPRMMGTASKLSGVFSSFMLIHVRHHKCQKFFLLLALGSPNIQ